MGQTGSPRRVSPRIYQCASIGGSHEGDSGSIVGSSKASFGERNSGTAGQKSNLPSSRGSSNSSLPIFVFSNAEETRFLASNPQFEAVEQTLYPSSQISYGNVSGDSAFTSPGHVGHVDRLKRRVSSHPDSLPVSQIPGLSLQGNRLLFQGTSFWPFNGPESVHKGDQGSPGSSSEQRNQGFCISGRLASPCRVVRRGFRDNRQDCVSPASSRLGGQFREVSLATVSVGSLPRSRTRSGQGHGSPFRAADPGTNFHGSVSRQQSSVTGKRMVTSLRTNGKHGGLNSLLPSVYEAHSSFPVETLLPGQASTLSESSGGSGVTRSSSVVDTSSQCQSGETVHRNASSNHDYDRCLSSRLGGSLADRDCVGGLVVAGEGVAYQSPGDGRSETSFDAMGPQSSRSLSDDSMRQLNDSILYQPSGRNKVSVSLSQDLGLTSFLPDSRYRPQGISPSGPDKRHGGCSVQRSVDGDGVVSFSDLGGSYLQDVRQTSSGSLRQRRQCEASNFLFPVLQSESMGNRCARNVLGRPLCLRLPSLVPDSQGSSQTAAISGGSSPGGSVLAETTVVPASPRVASGQSVQVSSKAQPSNSESGEDLASEATISSPFCLDVIHRQFQKEGLSREAADVAACSRRSSTIRTYDSRLERFRSWAQSNDIDPLEASVGQVAEFFKLLFSEGKQVSTIRNYRSAIAAVHRGFGDGSFVGSNDTLRHLLRGMFNKRPMLKRLAPSWSINDVLSSLGKSPFEPIHNSPLELLTYKTLFLVAAASARRRSELHALTIKKGFFRFSADGVHLLPDPSFMTKNQTVSFTPEEIFLPSIATTSSIREDRWVCPVRALKWYVEKTKSIRTSERLFIIPRAPFTPASKDTLSKWIVKLILPHVNREDSVRAHDIRAHASSRAWFAGVPLEEILRAAAWKTPSSFVASYLTDIVSSQGAFARAALGVSTSRTPGLPPASRC